MKTSNTLVGLSGLIMLFAFTSTGCATKKYVRQQTTPIQQRVEEVDQKHSEALASLEAKEQKDISRVEERVMTVENRANEAARAAQEADAKAVQAGEAARNATEMARENQGKIGTLTTAFQNMENYKLITAEDVLFGFNRYELTPEAKAKLDQIVQQTSGMTRYVLEVEGFTDRSGPSDYNLALSRRRADAVVRYLVDRNIPLRRIHMIGLGEYSPTQGGEAMSPREQRRVVVKVWVPENSVATATSAQAMTPQP
ncbi:MAG TPA: OmpA family protein [Bryobacteraceae bacterium]|nr:OmpA family protein [Bryobacteraceae bacterium]